MRDIYGFASHCYNLKTFYVQIRKRKQDTPKDELNVLYHGGLIVGNQDRSKPGGKSKRTAIILGVVVLGVVFALPVFPMTYYIPYMEEVPTLKLIVQTSVVVNFSGIPLEGGDHKFWHIQIEDDRVVEFSLESSETVHAAIMSLEEYEAFQGTNSMDPSIKSRLDADSIELEIQIPVTETYFFVIYNHHDGSQGTENKGTIIDSVMITESWEEEVTEMVMEQRVREETATVTLWQILTGSTPVY
jgi:hypothetical protein